jgi:transposase
MRYIEGKDRTQGGIFPDSLEAAIGPVHEVRIIDAFVESLDLDKMGFIYKLTIEGRPGYHPKTLLKLFIYGYLNGIRSSRKLEIECKRNIELLWLMKTLAPDHNTIANFRKENEKGLREVFRQSVCLANDFKLIGASLIAGDGTKIRAQNSKKNNFSAEKIARHIVYIDKKLDEYTQALSTADNDKKVIVEQEIQTQTERKAHYEALSKALEDSGEKQISTTDPESRLLKNSNGSAEVSYNINTISQ